MKQSNRTVHFAMFLAVLMVGTAYLLREHKDVALYALASLGFLAVPPAMRHSIGDLALGGGLKGAWNVLSTSAQPPAAAPEAKR